MRNSITKVVLDIGNFKIKALAGKLSEEGKKLEVLGYVEKYSRGIKKSVIEDPERLSSTIKDVLSELKVRTGLHIESVSIGVGGQFVKSRTTSVKEVFLEKEIEESDLEELFKKAEKEILLRGEKILKREIYNMRVNNSGIIRNPIGHTGKELQGDIHFIIVDEAYVEQLTEVINRAGYQVENVTLNVFASSKTVLTEEDTKMGVAVIDIGEGSTDIIIFKNDKMIYAQSISLGGMHYLNDISYILKKSKSDSFELISKLIKKEISIEDNKEWLNISSGEKIPLNAVKKIVDARTGDIINFINAAIEESGFKGYLGKGLVFTGGTVEMEAVLEKITNKMNYQVRKILPYQLRGLENVKSNMATAIGILLEIMKDEHDKRLSSMHKEQEKPVEALPQVPAEDIETMEYPEQGEGCEVVIPEIPEEEPKKKNRLSSIVKEFFSNFI